MVTNTGLYHYLYDVITKEKEMKTKGKSSEWSKGNRFGLLCPPDSDDDSV